MFLICWSCRVWGFYITSNQTSSIYKPYWYYQAFCCPVETLFSLFFPYWNGGTLFGHLKIIKSEGMDGFEDVGRKMAKLGLHPNATDALVQRQLSMLEPLHDFCKNCLELAYAFLCIMAYAIKEAELLHDDLSPSNVMFHFGTLDDVHRVFMNVIDWGWTSSPKEKIYLHYVVQDEVGRRQLLALRRWVNPSFGFYKVGTPKSSYGAHSHLRYGSLGGVGDSPNDLERRAYSSHISSQCC